MYAQPSKTRALHSQTAHTAACKLASRRAAVMHMMANTHALTAKPEQGQCTCWLCVHGLCSGYGCTPSFPYQEQYVAVCQLRHTPGFNHTPQHGCCSSLNTRRGSAWGGNCAARLPVHHVFWRDSTAQARRYTFLDGSCQGHTHRRTEMVHTSP